VLDYNFVTTDGIRTHFLHASAKYFIKKKNLKVFEQRCDAKDNIKPVH
jgi:hypothetical protein